MKLIQALLLLASLAVGVSLSGCGSTDRSDEIEKLVLGDYRTSLQTKQGMNLPPGQQPVTCNDVQLNQDPNNHNQYRGKAYFSDGTTATVTATTEGRTVNWEVHAD